MSETTELVKEEAEVGVPERAIKRSRLEESEEPEVETWRCFICHEDFPMSTRGNVAVRNCKHPLCDSCFLSQNTTSRRKCDMCHKSWRVQWVALPEPGTTNGDPDFDSVIMVPTYGGTLPLVGTTCYFFGAGGSFVPLNEAHKLSGVHMDVVVARFPNVVKRQSPETILGKVRNINTSSHCEIYPINEREYVILLLRDNKSPRLHVDTAMYNALYIDVARPREYLNIKAGGVIKASLKMKRKGKHVSLRACAAVFGVLSQNNILLT
jgi:hypothetical protein